MPTRTVPRASRSSASLRESVARELEGLWPGQLRKVRDFIRWLKLGPLVNKIDPDQTYFWTPAWQAKERAAEEDVKQGRVRTFDTLEDMVAFLEAQ